VRRDNVSTLIGGSFQHVKDMKAVPSDVMPLVKYMDAENSFKRAMALGGRLAVSSPSISLLTCALAAMSITIFFNFNENILSSSFTDLIADYLLLNFLDSFGLLPRLFDIPDMRAVGFTVILGLISTSVL
jgi:hypothetical protein